MKRRVFLILLVIFCMVALAGCGKNDTVEVNIPSEDKTIFASKTLWHDSCDNLYEIPMDTLDGAELAQVYRLGNDLLFTYEAYDAEKEQRMYTVKLVSVESGEVLYEQQLEPLTYGVVQVLDKHVAINDLGDGKSYLLNDKLELVDTYDLQGGMFCLDKNGKRAYKFTYDNGIEVVDLAAKETSSILENGVNLHRQGNFVSL